MSTGKRRKAAAIARDRKRISGLYLQGWLQVDIAEEVKLSQATVSRDLKALHKEWLADASRNFSEARAKELAKIDFLELTYWEAWRRSCDDAETVTQKQSIHQAGDGGPSQLVPKEATRTVKGQTGDKRFLDGVQWCIERRCKLLGLDEPDRLDVTTGGEQIDGRDSDERRIALLAAMLDKARARSDGQASDGAADGVVAGDGATA
jgi:hypothetical protein